MADTVIRVENLGKQYRIGALRNRTDGLRHALEDGVRRLGRRFRGQHNQPRSETFWALKDVSFEVKRGECVGVIGRNGAGKSTLLKLLSRITEPTTGEIGLRGRVGSLLEVGTGFHAELTGRENIFLNGAILGMSRREIERKFDDIVAFSEIEQFLDTPVKRYSSGMYVRLAFAVAAHLEPEILIVDEVLAVGDVQFQKKCLGKMGEVAKEGRTVLFVSHNLATVKALCQSSIVLANGRIIFTGDANAGIQHYLGASASINSNYASESRHGVQLLDASITDLTNDQRTFDPVFNQAYRITIDIDFMRPLSSGTLVMDVFDLNGILVGSICSVQEGLPPEHCAGRVRYEFDIPKLQLIPRQYTINISVRRPHDNTLYLDAENAMRFEVHPAIINNAMWAYTSDRGYVRVASAARVHRC